MTLSTPPHVERSLTPVIAWFIGFFAMMNVYPIQTVLPLIQSEFLISKSQSGLLVGVTLFAVALLSPFIGLISDRFGRKNIICISLVFLSLPTLLIPLSDSLWQLLLLRFVQGFFLPGVIVVSMAYMAEEVSSARIAQTTTAYVSGTVVGGFMGRFIVGHTAQLTGDWRTGFLILVCLSAFGLALVIKYAPSSKNFIPSTNLKQSMRIFKEHLKSKALLSACGIGFFVLFSITSGFTYVAYLLHAEPFKLNTSIIANIFAVYLIGAAITPLSSKMINTIGKKRSTLLALALSATGISLTLIPSLPVVIIGMACLGTGVFICQSTAIAFIGANVQFGRSLATGLYNMSYYSGGAAGSWITGLAYERFQWLGAVLTILCSLFIAAMITSIFWRRRTG